RRLELGSCGKGHGHRRGTRPPVQQAVPAPTGERGDQDHHDYSGEDPQRRTRVAVASCHSPTVCSVHEPNGYVRLAEVTGEHYSRYRSVTKIGALCTGKTCAITRCIQRRIPRFLPGSPSPGCTTVTALLPSNSCYRRRDRVRAYEASAVIDAK